MMKVGNFLPFGHLHHHIQKKLFLTSEKNMNRGETRFLKNGLIAQAKKCF